MARLQKSKASSASNHHTCDPDFYALPFLPELTQTFCLYKEEDNNPAELLPTINPEETDDSAAVALPAVGASRMTTTTTSSVASGSSSKKRPRAKSNNIKSFRKKCTDECIPPITETSVGISHPTTNARPEWINPVRNPPSLSLMPPHWSATTTTSMPHQREQPRILLAAPTPYLPSITNVVIPSPPTAVLDMEFHTRILRAQENIARLSSAWMEARWARMAAARRNESRQSWIPTMLHEQSNTSTSLPLVVAVSSLPTVEPRGLVLPNSLISSTIPRLW